MLACRRLVGACILGFVIENSSSEAQATLGLKHSYCFSAATAPFFLLVHGRAGTVDLMWTFRRCLPEFANVISVEAPLADPIGGYSWWPIERAEWESGAMIAYQTLVVFLEQAQEFYNLRPVSKAALGFSQGGGLLSLLVQRAPHALDAAALLASFVIEDTALPAPPLPKIFMAHGSADKTIPITKAQAGSEYLKHKGFSVEFVEDSVGHKVGAGGMRELKSFCGLFRS